MPQAATANDAATGKTIVKAAGRGGFTRLDRAAAIALLGILAAVATPHLGSLERDARRGEAAGLSHGLRRAAEMAHALYLATGTTPVHMQGNAIAMTNGFPDADDIAAAVPEAAGFAVTVDGPSATFVRIDAGGRCEVVYNDAEPDWPPVIAIDDSGC